MMESVLLFIGGICAGLLLGAALIVAAILIGD